MTTIYNFQPNQSFVSSAESRLMCYDFYSKTQKTVRKSRKADNTDKKVGYQIKKKTELCKHYVVGEYCPLGEKCSFAHGQQELVTKTYVHSNYKTIKCKHFHKEMFCQYGSRCQFVHSIPKAQVASKKNDKSYTQSMKSLEKSFATQSSDEEDIEQFIYKQSAKSNLKKLSVFDLLVRKRDSKRTAIVSEDRL